MGKASFIHNYARTLAGQMGIKAGNYRTHQSRFSVINMLVNVRWLPIYRHLEKASDATVGKLARSGLGNFPEIPKDRVKMVDVHRNDNGTIRPWLNHECTGADLVAEIATTAVVAAMAEIIWADLMNHQRAANSENSDALGNPSF